MGIERMSPEDIRKPIEARKLVDDPLYGTRYEPYDIPVEPVSDKDLAKLAPKQRIRKVREMQVGYWRPVLKKNAPDLYEHGDEGSMELAEILYDYKFKKREPNKKRSRDSEILQETVLDIFIRDYLLDPEGAEKIRLATEDITRHSAYKNEDVIGLLEDARNYLAKCHGREKCKLFEYKPGGDNFTSTNDAAVMRNLITNAHARADERTVTGALAEASLEMLNFYWSNVRQLYPDNEKAPYSALIHDYLYAASLTDNRAEFGSQARWILNRAGMKKEAILDMSAAYKIRLGEEIALQKHIKKYADKNGLPLWEQLLDPDEEAVNEYIRKSDKNVAVSKYYDRLTGIEAAAVVLDELGDNRLNELVGKLSNQSVLRQGGDLAFLVPMGWKARVTTVKPIQLLYETAGSFAGRDVFDSQSEYLSNMVGKNFPALEESDYLNITDKNRHIETLTETEADTASGKRIITEALVYACFLDTSSDKASDQERVRTENQELVNKIRDGNKWFVALNGDTFSRKYNPDLKEYGLESVSFRPVNFGKAGHRIDFVTGYKKKDGLNHSFGMIIDREGEVVFPEAMNVVVPKWLMMQMQNFALKRLNYITSGALVTAEENNQVMGRDKDREGSEVITRRAHYMYLTSTEKRTYSLSSPEAVVHAEHVLEKYGINLRLENIKRWLAGTLDKNQVITFVKEVCKEGAMPYQLVYDPNKIQDSE